MRRLALILALVLIPPTADAFYGARRVLLASKLAAGYSGALDVVSGQAATACYSLRACSVAWATASGKLVEIKRASDSHTCDVLAATAGGFGLTANCSSGGDAGQTASAFCTSTTCTVIDFYDQSGNSLDANVVEHAPTLAFNCLNTSLPCVHPNSTTGLVTTSTISVTQPFTFSFVGERTSNFTTTGSAIGCSSANGASSTVANGWQNQANTSMIYAGTITGATATDSVLHSIQDLFDIGASTVNVDGTLTTGLNPNNAPCTTANSTGNIEIAPGGYQVSGNIAEGIMFPVGLTTTQQNNLCHNQRLYWGSAGSC